MSDFIPRLMLVTPPLDAASADAALAALADIPGDLGVSVLLLRGGTLDDDSFARLADPLIAAGQARDIAVLLEDRPELLAASGADGLHLTIAGRKSPVKALRRRFGDDAILGAGCGNSRHQAMTAGEEGADYLGFGDLDGSEAADPEVIVWWEMMMTPPQVALGAKTLEEAQALAAAGPDFLALGPAFWLAEEAPAQALRTLLDSLAGSG